MYTIYFLHVGACTIGQMGVRDWCQLQKMMRNERLYSRGARTNGPRGYQRLPRNTLCIEKMAARAPSRTARAKKRGCAAHQHVQDDILTCVALVLFLKYIWQIFRMKRGACLLSWSLGARGALVYFLCVCMPRLL